MKNALLLFGIFLSLGIFITSCGGPAPQEGGEEKEAMEAEAANHDHEGHDHATPADSTAEGMEAPQADTEEPAKTEEAADTEEETEE
jgi:hypothetical protein